jgi:hypothetical protein
LSNSSITFLGSTDNVAIFTNETHAAVIDVELGMLFEIGEIDSVIGSNEFELTESEISEDTYKLAEFALSQVKVETLVASSRLYTIPKNVQEEAKKSLKWRKEQGRGGTPVGLNTAKTLAAGGQISIGKLRHIAKYFPRHEVDKKAKGWKQGEENFPSNGRISWSLWGGDGAWRWSRAIVEIESKKTIKADGYANPELEDFNQSYTSMNESVAPEFLARVRMDGSGIDRIYKIDMTGEVYVWDDGLWDDLGNVDSNVWDYDAQLDGTEDLVEKTHVMIDPESAIDICARMQSRPFDKVLVSDLDEDEYQLVEDSLGDEDWELSDLSITAAGETSDASKADSDGDGKLDPAFLSEKAKNQPRSAAGEFVKAGTRTVVAGDRERGSGVITEVNSTTGKVKVELDSGKTIEVDAKFTRSEDDDNNGPKRMPTAPSSGPMDLSGILGEPRTPAGYKAQLPGTMRMMTSEDLYNVINNFPAYVRGMRESYKLYEDSSINRLPASKRKGAPTSGLKDYDRRYMDERYGLKASAEKQKTDVPAIYMAVVAPEDPQSVLHLISIVPAGIDSNEPMTYERQGGEWVREPKFLADLKSPTPPAVIKIEDNEILKDVLEQVDTNSPVTASIDDYDLVTTVLFGPNPSKELQALIAAGGLDRNRGGAAKLRRYWTKGKGGAKIRWNTGGDWTRCVRYLRKYLGPRAKGYCALRHKEMTGMWTGDKKHRQLYGSGQGLRKTFSTDMVRTSEALVETLALNAKKQDASEKMALVASSSPSIEYKMLDKTIEEVGFIIPMVVPEEAETGDGRKFKNGSIGVRELPLPLMWQIKTSSGHDGSYVVGRIDSMERVDGGIGNAVGVFDTSPYAQEVVRLIRNGFIKGISADMDKFEAVEELAEQDNASKKDSKKRQMGKEKIVISQARIMGITIVAKPAFQECKIELANDQQTINPQEEPVIEDGIYVDDVDELDATSLVACGYVAGAIPMTPPTDWFGNPNLKEPTPLTVDDDGRVFGHIAAWHQDHIGLRSGTKPPRSRSNYAYFHTGVLRTEDGKDVPVGQLTLAGGHAPLEASASEAVRHYDDTASSIADVHAGEDQFGIWVAGALRPGTGPEQIRSLRASAPSGDWRPIRNSLELVAVCQVNVPGFPIARARVASGAVMALVAAGAQSLARLKSDPLSELNERLAKLERPDLESRVLELKSVIASAKESEYGDFAVISEKVRMKLAKEGKALPDGSYPIRNVSDLKNAIQAFGRSKDKDAAKKHIIKRAKDLQRYYDLIPEEWRSKRYRAFSAEELDLTARVASAKDSLSKKALAADTEEEVAPVTPIAPVDGEEAVDAPETVESGLKDAETGRFTPQTQPRDEGGKFRRVLARLKRDLGTAGLQSVVEEAKYVQGLHEVGNYVEAVNAGSGLLDILGRLDSGALNKVSLENVRSSASELGKVISNLPLGFNNQNEKVRYSDLPPVLQQLMDDMMERVETKIGKEDADIATKDLKGFKSGSDVYSQGEISSQMSKMLRLLT